jgi:hypothetical protein
LLRLTVARPEMFPIEGDAKLTRRADFSRASAARKTTR